jgi:oxalate decarboxylase/phosphoglucose isomerase-like protein (cupin superfamily)
MDMIHLPKGATVRGYARLVEDAYFVLADCITVGWEESGHTAEERLGPKDVIFTPAGRVHYFRNDGVADAEFMLLVGTARVEEVRLQAA